MIRRKPSKHALANLKSERLKADLSLNSAVARVLPDCLNGRSLIEDGIAFGNFEGVRVGLGKRQIDQRHDLFAFARVDARDK